mmetsp:Transcript_19972/g.43709  ORF Transcript_19972/g.43709 Transcript_19972/m.43709 type:complete len:342 (-) Transcript_19972:120-1145(-)
MDLRIATFLLAITVTDFHFAWCRSLPDPFTQNVYLSTRLDTRRTQLREQLERTLSASGGRTHDAEAECVDFLVSFMPARDLDDPEITAEFLLKQTQLALAARNATAWARSVPWDKFKNDVLPYAVLGEPRDGDWRTIFNHKFSPLVKNVSSITEAAQTLNEHIWHMWQPNIVFVPDQTPAIMSPFEVLKNRRGSCTGLSTFLVDAYRSVGVPARAVGTANWATPEGGNHCWVEFWDKTWSFTGAAEFNGRLNDTWFFPYPAKMQSPGSELCNGTSIYASSWAPTPERKFWPLYWLMDDSTGECQKDSRYVNAYDVTTVYLGAAEPTRYNGSLTVNDGTQTF